MDTTPQAQRGQDLTALYEQYFKACAAAKKADQYIRECRSLFARVADACNWITSEDMRGGANAFEDYLLELQTKTTAKTRNNALCAMRTFAEWLVHREVLSFNPFERIPIARHFGGEGSRALSPPEMQAMIDVALADEAKPKPKRSGKRSIWYTFARATGMRAREMSLIRVGDFRLGTVNCVVVRPEIGKGGRGRTIPLSPHDVPWITAMLGKRDPLDRFIDDKRPRHETVAADAKEAGISRKNETIGLHSFRKGMLTAHAANGTPLVTAAALAGHSTTKQTEKVYIARHLLPIQAAVDALAATGYGESKNTGAKLIDPAKEADSVCQRRDPMKTAKSQPSPAAAASSLPGRGSVVVSTAGTLAAAADCVCACGRVSPTQASNWARQDSNLSRLCADLLEAAARLIRELLPTQGGSDGPNRH